MTGATNRTGGSDSAREEQGSYKIPALRALSEITTSLSSDADVEGLLARFLGTLATLPDLATTHAVKPPALVIVGEVVVLHERLRWFAGAGDAVTGETSRGT
jgi:hypothetical protein